MKNNNIGLVAATAAAMVLAGSSGCKSRGGNGVAQRSEPVSAEQLKGTGPIVQNQFNSGQAGVSQQFVSSELLLAFIDPEDNDLYAVFNATTTTRDNAMQVVNADFVKVENGRNIYQVDDASGFGKDNTESLKRIIKALKGVNEAISDNDKSRFVGAAVFKQGTFDITLIFNNPRDKDGQQGNIRDQVDFRLIDSFTINRKMVDLAALRVAQSSERPRSRGRRHERPSGAIITIRIPGDFDPLQQFFQELNTFVASGHQFDVYEANTITPQKNDKEIVIEAAPAPALQNNTEIRIPAPTPKPDVNIIIERPQASEAAPAPALQNNTEIRIPAPTPTPKPDVNIIIERPQASEGAPAPALQNNTEIRIPASTPTPKPDVNIIIERPQASARLLNRIGARNGRGA